MALFVNTIVLQLSGCDNSSTMKNNSKPLENNLAPHVTGEFFPPRFKNRSELIDFHVNAYKTTTVDLVNERLIGATIEIGSGGYLPYAAIYQLNLPSGEWELAREYFPKPSAMQYHFAKTDRGFALRRSDTSSDGGSVQEMTICEVLTNGKIVDSAPSMRP